MHLFYTYLLPHSDFERVLYGHGLLTIILLQKPYNSLFQNVKPKYSLFISFFKPLFIIHYSASTPEELWMFLEHLRQ